VQLSTTQFDRLGYLGGYIRCIVCHPYHFPSYEIDSPQKILYIVGYSLQIMRQKIGSRKARKMSKLVLTIDDQSDIRSLIRMTLEFFDHTVIEANSGEEGIRLMRSRKPDLVLLDVMMPGMNGLQVAKIICNDPLIKNIPIIMLTAINNSSDVAAGLAVGAKFYLKKPFSPADLLDKIDAVLEGA